MELLELVERLVGFDTVSKTSSTRKMADFISNYLETAGFRIEQYPYETDGLEKVNVIARKGEGETRLALAGHMDTVSYSGWKTGKQSDALQLAFIKTQKQPQGAFFGRGVADMKLFLATAMKAGEAVRADELKHSFALCFTSDEEEGCLGARKLRNDQVRIADYIIVGEPTQMYPIYAHKGYIYPRIELIGKEAHSSAPEDGGISVVPALTEVLDRISELENRLMRVRDARFFPPHPTVNVGVITVYGSYERYKKQVEAAPSKNKTAGYCLIEMEIRPVPGQRCEEIANVLRELVGHKIGEVEVRFKLKRRPAPPMITPLDSPIIRLAEKISGKKAITVPFNTEAGIYNRCGAQSVVWGPGSIKQAHDNAEFVEADFFKPEIAEQYVRAIREFCC